MTLTSKVRGQSFIQMQTIDHKKLSLTCAPKSSTMGKKMGPPTFKIKGRLGQGHSRFALKFDDSLSRKLDLLVVDLGA